MSRDDFRRKADLVRAIPLEVVLAWWGVGRDGHDRSRWHSERGPLSVTGTQFYNWHVCQGGGGAIDLVMHLGGWDAKRAIEWLGHQVGGPRIEAHTMSPSAVPVDVRRQGDSPGDSAQHQRNPALRLPAASPTNLPRLRRYLTERRGLSAAIMNSLIDEGRLYADARGNAVFLMVTGKPNRPIGAELRGTGKQVWRGLAPGTLRNAGYFWIGTPESRRIVLCESAIDAVSCFQIQTTRVGAPLRGPCLCISTAGARPDAPWLGPLLAGGYQIHCGFDADEPGERASCKLIARHPSIRRLRPPQHDWNESLVADQQ